MGSDVFEIVVGVMFLMLIGVDFDKGDIICCVVTFVDE